MGQSNQPVEEIAKILDAAGLLPTFDPEANVVNPCFHCKGTGGPMRLAVVGFWTSDSVGTRGRAGSPIRRPLCAACDTPDADVRPVPPPWKELVDLVEGARVRGFDEGMVAYLQSVVGVTWAKAFRAGEAASRR